MSLDKKKALVLLSGGMDSTTALFWAIKCFDSVEAVSFDYGQKNSAEILCAKKVTKAEKIKLTVIDVPMVGMGSMSGTSKGAAKFPHTDVPLRNTLFVVVAAQMAASRGIGSIVVGACDGAKTKHADSRAGAFATLGVALNSALGDVGVYIQTPLISMDKGGVFRMASHLGISDTIINDTLSCYMGDTKTKNEWGMGCGLCDACVSRSKGHRRWAATVIEAKPKAKRKRAAKRTARKKQV